MAMMSPTAFLDEHYLFYIYAHIYYSLQPSLFTWGPLVEMHLRIFLVTHIRTNENTAMIL